MKRNIHVVSQFNASINEVTEDLIKELNFYYTITREGLENPLSYDILLCHFINSKITNSPAFDKFKHKVLIQPIDGTSIQEDIIKEINKFDVIITPGNAGKKIMIKNGVTKEIKVIPNFYTLDDFLLNKPNKKLLKEVGNKYMFYHESTCHPRKGIKEMLEAYINTFSSNQKEPDVILVLKCPPHNNTTFDVLEQIKIDIGKLQSQYKYPAKILKISQWLDKKELNQLMDRCDCYIQPSKIEGFGIPLLRAVIKRKQIIAMLNEFSGYLDFLTTANCLFFRGRLETAIGEINPIYKSDTQWLTPDLEDLEWKMFLAHSRKEIMKNQLKEEDILLLNKYGIDNIINEYRKVFDSEFLSNKQRFFESSIELNNVRIKYYLPRGNSGYSQAAKDYVIGLSKEIPITVDYLIFDNSDYQTGERNKIINSLKDKEINYNKVIIHSTPEHWGKIIKKERLKNPDIEIIGFAVWETDKIDDRWIEWINEVDKVIVPCTWNKEVFEKCGIIKPIEVIPHIFNPFEIKPAIINGVNSDDYVFYTIGQWSNRKGIADVIKVYLDEFKSTDKVCLVVKTFGDNFSGSQKNIIRNKVNNILKYYSDPAKIVLVLGELSDEQIQALHKRGDCYVSLAKAEGYGLGMLDAAGNNKPVISTAFGGQLDFLQSNLLVGYDLVPVKGMEWIPWYNEKQNWAQPKLKHAQKIMRELFENKEKELIYAKINGSKIQSENSQEKITKKIINFLKK